MAPSQDGKERKAKPQRLAWTASATTNKKAIAYINSLGNGTYKNRTDTVNAIFQQWADMTDGVDPATAIASSAEASNASAATAATAATADSGMERIAGMLEKLAETGNKIAEALEKIAAGAQAEQPIHVPDTSLPKGDAGAAAVQTETAPSIDGEVMKGFLDDLLGEADELIESVETAGSQAVRESDAAEAVEALDTVEVAEATEATETAFATATAETAEASVAAEATVAAIADAGDADAAQIAGTVSDASAPAMSDDDILHSIFGTVEADAQDDGAGSTGTDAADAGDGNNVLDEFILDEILDGTTEGMQGDGGSPTEGGGQDTDAEAAGDAAPAPAGDVAGRDLIDDILDGTGDTGDEPETAEQPDAQARHAESDDDVLRRTMGDFVEPGTDKPSWLDNEPLGNAARAVSDLNNSFVDDAIQEDDGDDEDDDGFFDILGF
jgi:hypothetical protein